MALFDNIFRYFSQLLIDNISTFSIIISTIIITNMSKQPLPSNAYLPSRSHTYYPIQPKKRSPQKIPAHHTLRVDKTRDRQVDTLRKACEQLKEREEIYIDKLMKLQEGLENQHSEFIKLQQLYTELFQSYKRKQSQIIQLEMKFRESDRYRQQERQSERPRENSRFADSRAKQYSFRQKEWSSREQEWEVKEKEWMSKQQRWIKKENELTEYIDSLNKKIIVMTESYERQSQQFSFFKGKEKVNSSNKLTEKVMNELQQWQKQVDIQRQSRLKFQYENQFLKNRNKDLEMQRQQFETLLQYKQKEINKLREEKIKIHRQSSEKTMHRSPIKTHRRSQIKTQDVLIDASNQKRREMAESEAKPLNSDHQKSKYFSFSREKHNHSVDSELPSFPPELEIDSIITQYKK